MKVLIIDDNQDITDLLSKFLKSKGIENTVANDPFDGLDRIKNEKYDIILLDMSMPEFSGIPVIKNKRLIGIVTKSDIVNVLADVK